MALKIKFNGTGDNEVDRGVHFESNLNDYTLCSLSLDGDSQTTGSYTSTKDKVDCEDCIRIVNYCKSIKSSEIKKE